MAELNVPAVMEPSANLEEAREYNHLLEPFLQVLLVSALMMGPVALVRAVTPGFPWIHMPFLIFFIALEGVWTTNWVRHPDRRILNKPIYRLAEFLVILIIVRLITWIIYIPLNLEVLRRYLLDPLSILDGAFLVFGLLALFTWLLSINYARIFHALALSREEEQYISATTVERQDRRVEGLRLSTITNRPQLIGAFISQWLNGGLVLMVCGALASVNLSRIIDEAESGIRTIQRLGLPNDLLLALLLYFFIGLVLLSRARLQLMRVRWLVDKVDPDPRVFRFWKWTSAFLLAGIATIAAFLPIGSTLPIAYLLNLIVQAVVAVASFLGLLFVALLALLSTLFSDQASPREEIDQLRNFEAPPSPGSEVMTEGLSEGARLALGTGFWLVLVGIGVVATIFFLRERGWSLDGTTLGMMWRDLRRGLRRLWAGLFGRVETARTALRTRLTLARNGGDVQGSSPFRFIRVNGLPPRERIRYFYLSTVRRAGERGVPREQSETPLEYLDDLRARWPDAEEDVNLLTEAFLEARYSPRPIEEEDVNPVKQTWRRVRSGLRRRRRSADEEE